MTDVVRYYVALGVVLSLLGTCGAALLRLVPWGRLPSSLLPLRDKWARWLFGGLAVIGALFALGALCLVR